MKNKVIRIPALFCTLFLVSLLFSGCARNNSIAIRYQAEKLLHNAEKVYEEAGIRPDLKNQQQMNKVKAAFNDVANYAWIYLDSISAQKNPEERRDLESIAFMAVNRLSGIYYTERNFDSAIVILHKLMAVTSLEGEPLLISEINLARSLQSKGDWAEAMKVFRSIIDTFYPPVDSDNQIMVQALNLPFELVRVYTVLGDSAGLAAQMQSAKSYYQRLLVEWPNSALARGALSNLSRLYMSEKNWDKAIEYLGQIKDSTGQSDIDAATTIADITSYGKKDFPVAIALYNALISRSKDSITTAAIYAREGKSYFDAQKYGKCREVMGYIRDNYPRYFQNNPIPQNFIALSLAQEGQWNLAENEFHWLIDNYPATEQAFDAFLIIADHYSQSGDAKTAQSWYQQANDFFDQVGRKYAGSDIEASAISYKAEIARRQGNWDAAVKSLLEINDKFPQQEIGQQAILNAAAIYREKLNDPQKAEALIERLKTELLPLGSGKKSGSITDVK